MLIIFKIRLDEIIIEGKLKKFQVYLVILNLINL